MKDRVLDTSEDKKMDYNLSISPLGAFPKLRKATVSFIMTLCPSLPLSVWNNSVTNGRIFMKFIMLIFFRKCVEEV